LSCSQASKPSMMTTSLVWFWVKLSMAFAILAINSTSHFRTCRKHRRHEKVKHISWKLWQKLSIGGILTQSPRYQLWFHSKLYPLFHTLQSNDMET
jgi:hypothetical protein